MKRLLVLLLVFTSTGWSQGVFSDGSGFFKTFWRDSSGVIVPVPAGKNVILPIPSAGSSGFLERSASGLPLTSLTQTTSGDPMILRGTSPYLILTSTGLNLNISSETQASDTSAFWMGYTSVTKKPLFRITGITGNIIADIDSTGLVGFGTTPDAGYELHARAGGTSNADFKLESGGGTEAIFAQSNGGALTISSDGSLVLRAASTSVSLQAGGANTSLIADRLNALPRVTVGVTGGSPTGRFYADSSYSISHFVGTGGNLWRSALGTDNRLEFYFNGTIRAAIDTAGAYNDLYP